MKLYEIDQGIEEALNKVVVDEETGEVTVTQDLEALEALQMQRDQKIENVALFYKNADAEAKAIAEEIKKLQARKKVLDNKCEGAKNWIAFALN
ncbi:MAG: siphovirus Gp157 family protein, partial [Clostridia bacterium]|nr:siphovirus Gp157 family protein [Clostridia bacterium]